MVFLRYSGPVKCLTIKSQAMMILFFPGRDLKFELFVGMFSFSVFVEFIISSIPVPFNFFLRMCNLDWLAMMIRDWIYRSSHRRCTIKNDVLKNLAKFAGKQLYRSLFCSLRSATLLKTRLWQWLWLWHWKCFPVNFTKF